MREIEEQHVIQWDESYMGVKMGDNFGNFLEDHLNHKGYKENLATSRNER